jgi:aspartate aminotransferase-like enzyme
MAADLSGAIEDLKKIVFCADGQPFIIAGAGTLAMEIALLNLAGPAGRVLVLSQGYFGDRMAQICRSFGIGHDLIASPWGSGVRPEELSERLASRAYDIVVATHVDTGTGSCAPIKEYAEVLKGRGILYVVDGVCATGGIEERMDDWGIDVVLTAAQKCFGAPPGLAIDVFSERAMDRRRSLTAVPAYYSDILRWLPVMKDPTKYFSTPCVNEIRAFRESARIMLEEGMDARFERHRTNARAVRAALRALGFGLFTRPEFLADTLSVAAYPAGVEDKAFRTLYAQNGVVVAGGLGEMAGKVFRMGHMGNLTAVDIVFAFEAMEKTLAALGYAFTPGAGVASAREALAP